MFIRANTSQDMFIPKRDGGCIYQSHTHKTELKLWRVEDSHSNCPSSVAWLGGVSIAQHLLVGFRALGKELRPTPLPAQVLFPVCHRGQTCPTLPLLWIDFATMPARLVTVMRTEDYTVSFHVQLP